MLSINCIELCTENIRKRPAMYVGSVYPSGVEHLVYELVANGIDLFLRKKATLIKVRINNKKISVADDGPGLPFSEKDSSTGLNKADYYLTHYHNTPTADYHSPHIHMLFRGVGLVVINALSKKLTVKSICNNTKWTQIYHRGIAQQQKIEHCSSGKGTIFTFEPDNTVFPIPTVRYEFIRSKLLQCAHLFPGIEIRCNNERFLSKNGLRDFIVLYYYNHYCSVKETTPFHFNTETPDFIIQVAAIGNTEKKTFWKSWANGSETSEHGTHVNSFKKALQKLKWLPQVAMIHIILKDARFVGPVKAKLANDSIVKPIARLLEEPLINYLKNEI